MQRLIIQGPYDAETHYIGTVVCRDHTIQGPYYAGTVLHRDHAMQGPLYTGTVLYKEHTLETALHRDSDCRQDLIVIRPCQVVSSLFG